MAALRPSKLVCDIGSLADADLGAVAGLARLHVASRRLGFDLVLHNGSDALVELVAFVGLADVLRFQPRGQAEEREQRLGGEEERKLDDPAG